MELKITGTVKVIEYCSADLDFHEEYNELLPFIGTKSITLDGKPFEPECVSGQQEYRKMCSSMKKPWVFHVGQPVDNYERTYILPDDAEPSKIQIVRTFADFTKFLLGATVSEYILYDGEKVYADDETYLLADDCGYAEYIVKR